MKRIIICASVLLFCVFTALRTGFAGETCDPYYVWTSDQTCAEPSSPPSNCVPRILGFTDCWDNTCWASPNDPNFATNTIFKNTTWRVCWPSGQIHGYRVADTGQCGATQNSCCGGTVYKRCWPSFFPPEIGQGYFTQTTYKASALFTGVEGCTGTPCSQYNVFTPLDDCGYVYQGKVFRSNVACCLGNNWSWDDPSFSDIDGDGWCQDRDCDDYDPDIHTGCGVGGGGGLEPCPGYLVQSCEDGLGWLDDWCHCHYDTPIIIDISGNGFDLTNAAGGVSFDLNADGTAERIGWPALGSDEAFLVLDRNGNGAVDNGAELFGNHTPQPPSSQPNGFLALLEYDKLVSGGNDDGVIDRRDAVFASLRLWQDSNHNGISEPGELHTLTELGVSSISLHYKISQRRDEYGNVFRYRAKVFDVHGSHIGRWAWDVFLVTQ